MTISHIAFAVGMSFYLVQMGYWIRAQVKKSEEYEDWALIFWLGVIGFVALIIALTTAI